jgi:hypothetical protein
VKVACGNPSDRFDPRDGDLIQYSQQASRDSDNSGSDQLNAPFLTVQMITLLLPALSR